MIYFVSEVLRELLAQYKQLRVTDPRRYAAITVAVTLILCLSSWVLFSAVCSTLAWLNRPSVAVLCEAALSSDHAEATKAAQLLDRMASAGTLDLTVVRKIATEARDESVRAIALSRLVSFWDYDSMPLLLEALNADSSMIRRTSAGVVSRLLGYDHRFPVDGTEKERIIAIKQISHYWDTYKESQLFARNKDRLKAVRN